MLATVVEERSVSRAAARLRQTQPAVSGSLKRLREIFGDALLVRDGTAMVPTARAAGLAVQARRALGELEALLVEPEVFVPAPVMVGDVKLALALAGTPLTPKVTMPLKPFVAVTTAE